MNIQALFHYQGDLGDPILGYVYHYTFPRIGDCGTIEMHRLEKSADGYSYAKKLNIAIVIFLQLIC